MDAYDEFQQERKPRRQSPATQIEELLDEEPPDDPTPDVAALADDIGQAMIVDDDEEGQQESTQVQIDEQDEPSSFRWLQYEVQKFDQHFFDFLIYVFPLGKNICFSFFFAISVIAKKAKQMIVSKLWFKSKHSYQQFWVFWICVKHK